MSSKIFERKLTSSHIKCIKVLSLWCKSGLYKCTYVGYAFLSDESLLL